MACKDGVGVENCEMVCGGDGVGGGGGGARGVDREGVGEDARAVARVGSAQPCLKRDCIGVYVCV